MLAVFFGIFYTVESNQPQRDLAYTYTKGESYMRLAVGEKKNVRFEYNEKIKLNIYMYVGPNTSRYNMHESIKYAN